MTFASAGPFEHTTAYALLSPQNLIKDVQRTAASRSVADPDFQRAARIVKMETPLLSELEFVVSKAQFLVESLRQGQMTSVFESLGKHLVREAGNIFMAKETAATASDVTFLLAALKKFHKLPGTSDAEAKLSAWATKRNATMAFTEVVRLSQEYVNSATANPNPLPDVTSDAVRFAQLFGKCKASFFAGAKEQHLLHNVLAYMIKDGFRKARLRSFCHKPALFGIWIIG